MSFCYRPPVLRLALSGVFNCLPRTIARANRARGRCLRTTECECAGSFNQNDWVNGRAPSAKAAQTQGFSPIRAFGTAIRLSVADTPDTQSWREKIGFARDEGGARDESGAHDESGP